MTVRMRMRNYDKLDHTQTTYLWLLILLHIYKNRLWSQNAGTSEYILNYTQCSQ